MKAQRLKAAHAKHSRTNHDNHSGSSLLVLPVEVLHKVLDLLGPHDLVQLLHTSKAMAVEVMQHSAGKLTYKLQLHRGAKVTAIRQLQWAPPSTLKLMLDGLSGAAICSWVSLWQALQKALPTSQQGQQLQQLPCITEACVQGFEMPSLLPPGLAALCPNMHTLHLCHCIVQDGKAVTSSRSDGSGSNNKAGSGSSSSTGADECTLARPANSLHTLILERVYANKSRVALLMQAAIQQARQLKRSLPNMTCLKLHDAQHATQVPPLFAVQLKELFISGPDQPSWSVSGRNGWAAYPKLQQLQQLVLPNTQVGPTDLEELLSLPSLTHLEVESVYGRLSEDYSSHTSKWQYLHLHLANEYLSLGTLAQLPLHALVHPLKLGNPNSHCMPVHVPSSAEGTDVLLSMERLAQQLSRCGVQLLQQHVAWSGWYSSRVYGYTPLPMGSRLAQIITVIAPAFGLHDHVSLLHMIVDQPIMEALVTVYGSCLRQLILDTCTFTVDMQPAWQAALSGLPALGILKLQECPHVKANDAEWEHPATVRARAVCQLALAMVHQPAGRCIQVMCGNKLQGRLFKPFAKLVLEGTKALLPEVELTIRDQVDVRADTYYDDDCVCTIRKHRV